MPASELRESASTNEKYNMKSLSQDPGKKLILTKSSNCYNLAKHFFSILAIIIVLYIKFAREGLSCTYGTATSL